MSSPCVLPFAVTDILMTSSGLSSAIVLKQKKENVDCEICMKELGDEKVYTGNI